MLFFSGLRGGIAFALAIKAKEDLGDSKDGQLILDCTLVIVLFTVWINGGLTPAALDYLKIKYGEGEGNDYPVPANGEIMMPLNTLNPSERLLGEGSRETGRSNKDVYTPESPSKDAVAEVFSMEQDDGIDQDDILDSSPVKRTLSSELKKTMARTRKNVIGLLEGTEKIFISKDNDSNHGSVRSNHSDDGRTASDFERSEDGSDLEPFEDHEF